MVPSLIVALVGVVVMFAMAATGVVVPAGFMVALICVFFTTHGRPGRLGGASDLRGGDIFGLGQRSGAEQGDEGTEQDGLAHGDISWASVPAAYPASDGTHYRPGPLTTAC
ncbi:MAG: hypothetical protein WAV72_05825 [Bradyrhizobium sp.]